MNDTPIPNKEWIREQLMHPDHLLDSFSFYLRHNDGPFPKNLIRPNFYFENNTHQIFGWISDEEDPDKLFIGISRQDSWVFAILPDSECETTINHDPVVA